MERETRPELEHTKEYRHTNGDTHTPRKTDTHTHRETDTHTHRETDTTPGEETLRG